MASFREAGKLIEYTANAAVDYHAVVEIGSLIGITRKSAVAGEKISCDAEGVFEFTKGSGALTAGTPVAISTDGSVSTSGTANGVVWADASADATTVDVKINVFVG